MRFVRSGEKIYRAKRARPKQAAARMHPTFILALFTVIQLCANLLSD